MIPHLIPAEIPYGVFWCPQCVALKACDVAVGESRADPECALECMTCDTRVGEVTDVTGRYPFEPVRTRRNVLTAEERELGRERARRLALGVFEPPMPGVPAPTRLPAPPPDFIAREAAKISTLRGGRDSR